VEDFYGGRYCTVAANYLIGDTSITVDGAGTNSAYIFTVGDVIKNASTGENMLVTAITNNTTIAVTRSFGTTAAAAGTAAEGLFIVGNVSEENSGARNVNTTRTSKETNYTLVKFGCSKIQLYAGTYR